MSKKTYCAVCLPVILSKNDSVKRVRPLTMKDRAEDCFRCSFRLGTFEVLDDE